MLNYLLLLSERKKVLNKADCQRSEKKKKKNRQEIKRTLFNRTKQDKTCKI